MAEWSKSSHAFKDFRDLYPEYIFGWWRHEFESHSQSFFAGLLIYLDLIKAYSVLSSLFE